MAGSSFIAHLLRHADARSRTRWEGDDNDRPLTATGARQAKELAKQLARRPIAAILSSPAERCRATVEPCAQTLGLQVAVDAHYAEGHSGAEAFARLVVVGESLEGSEVLMCSHGDVLEEILDILVRAGVILKDERRFAKAGRFELSIEGGKVRAARGYRPPSLGDR